MQSSRLPEPPALAGWSPEEVAAALVELADNYMLSVLANRRPCGPQEMRD